MRLRRGDLISNADQLLALPVLLLFRFAHGERSHSQQEQRVQ
jgi:hypothetical protein